MIAPVSDRCDMERRPVILLVCALVLGSGTLLCAAGAWANTDNQGSQVATELPATSLRSGKAAQSYQQEVVTDVMPEQQGGIAFGNPACLQGIAGAEHADDAGCGKTVYQLH